MLNKTAFPDSLILEKINNKEVEGWEYLYDAYAPLMLSVIYKLTADKTKAEKILIKVFTAQAFEDMLYKIKEKIGIHTSGFSFNYTLNYLREEGIEPNASCIASLPKIFRFMYFKNSIKEKPNTKISKPVFKPVYSYKWYPLTGIDINA
ncbi:MAG: hypothetical protein EOP53_04950 [Sphingobacteriales bacterium]|nr:MAG: hypothetical protein EOP53_04950 [Sphingobacteriales bacterium]